MSKNDDNDIIEIKTVLVGDSGVGKTNLINVCVGQPFNSDSTSTNCSSLIQKSLNIDNLEFLVNLWDTMGQEVYKGLSKLFFREAHIVIFVYDITVEESFNHLEEWIQMANETIGGEYIAGIVGNKNDLYLEAKVTEEKAVAYAKNKNMKFKLVSAKEDPDSFNDILIELIKEHKVPENRKKTVLNNKSEKKKSCC